MGIWVKGEKPSVRFRPSPPTFISSIPRNQAKEKALQPLLKVILLETRSEQVLNVLNAGPIVGISPFLYVRTWKRRLRKPPIPDRSPFCSSGAGGTGRRLAEPQLLR